MAKFEVQHEQEPNKGKFYIGSVDDIKAETTYSKAGDDKMIIDHTWVDDSLRGQGAGDELVMAIIDYARSSSIKIIPLCPFARSVFAKNDQIRDVLV